MFVCTLVCSCVWLDDDKYRRVFINDVLIAKYTRPYFCERVGPDVKITAADGLQVPDDYFVTIKNHLFEHLQHRRQHPRQNVHQHQQQHQQHLSDGLKQDLQPIDPEPLVGSVLDTILDYMSETHHYPRNLIQNVQNCFFRVFEDIVYFFDSYENNVLGYVKFDDSDSFEFVRDGTADVFSDLNRGLTRYWLTTKFHNRTHLFDSPPETSSNSKQTIICMSHPTNRGSDTKMTSRFNDPSGRSNVHLLDETDPNGFNITNRFTGKSSWVKFSKPDSINQTMIFEPSENRFVQMVLYVNDPATFREVIIHSDRSTSFKELTSSANTLCVKDADDSKIWRSYRGTLLRYDPWYENLTLISVSGDHVPVRTFEKVTHFDSILTDHYWILCGRWFIEVTYCQTYINISRFSLDLRVLT